MDIDKQKEYELVLQEIINNRYNPISPKRMKELFGIDKIPPKTAEYDKQKISLQRILNFYTTTKIMTIVTDTTLNEINRLKKIKKNVEIPLEKRAKYDKYIQLLSNKKKATEERDNCKKYSVVEKTVETADSTKTTYKLIGDKFTNISINYFGEEISTDNTTEIISIEDVVDLNDDIVSPYHIMYRLFLECDFEYYGYDKEPIEFQIPQKNVNLFISFFVSMVSTYNVDIKSEKLIEISRSNTFQITEKTKEFIINTITKIVIKMIEYHRGNSPYSIKLLLDLILFQSKLNIKITIDDENINLSKTSIKKLIIKENEFDLKLKNTTVTLTDINQIKSIQSYDSSDLKEDILKLKSILTEYPIEHTKVIIQLIEDVENIEDIFIF